MLSNWLRETLAEKNETDGCFHRQSPSDFLRFSFFFQSCRATVKGFSDAGSEFSVPLSHQKRLSEARANWVSDVYRDPHWLSLARRSRNEFENGISKKMEDLQRSPPFSSLAEKKEIDGVLLSGLLIQFCSHYKWNRLLLRAIAFLFIIFLFHVNITASCSSTVCNKKYDVFLSFRGADVRQGFLSHLHKALVDQDIEAFVDYQLERGKEISESLLEKIEQSLIAIVIFSPNYAHSEWCLEELLKIAECRERNELIAIPVFYGVDPSHVQDLTGDYGDAMAQLRTKFDEAFVEKLGNALKDTASLSGLVSSSFNTESQLIEEIIKQVLEILNSLYPSNSALDGGLVGIDSRVEKVMSLLSGPEVVCVVGIWGEPGIGKTTLARATFDRIRSQFDYRCFVGDVRERCERFTAAAIQNEVLSHCFGISDLGMSRAKLSGMSRARKKLSRKKVILVLDDVSNLSQIKLIMLYKIDMGCGSRIIVTSRDMRLLEKMDAKIYAVEKLHHHEALELFLLHAFHKKVPEDGYLERSERAVKCAQGLPLALEVLGGNLFKRSVAEWEDELEKLRCFSGTKSHKCENELASEGSNDCGKKNSSNSDGVVFNCLVSNLKTVEIIGLSEKDDRCKLVFNFVEFLLKNGRKLEKMVFKLGKCRKRFVFDVSKKLLKHPNAPMDWNAAFFSYKNLVFGVEMFRIFG